MQGPEHVIELFHGYTYSGHPLATAAALAMPRPLPLEGFSSGRGRRGGVRGGDDELRDSRTWWTSAPSDCCAASIPSPSPTARGCAAEALERSYHELDLYIRVTGDTDRCAPAHSRCRLARRDPRQDGKAAELALLGWASRAVPRGHDRRAMARAGQNLFKAGGARVAFAQACPKARSRCRSTSREIEQRASHGTDERSVVVRVGPHRLTTTDLIVVLGMVLVAVALSRPSSSDRIPAGEARRGAHRRGCAARRPCARAPLGALKGEVARLQAELDVLNGLRGIGEVPPARRTSAAPPAPPAGPRARRAADAAKPGSCRRPRRGASVGQARRGHDPAAFAHRGPSGFRLWPRRPRGLH